MKTEIREVMTRNPVSCTVTDDMASVAALMDDYKTFVIPVSEKHGQSQLLGMITAWDLCTKVVAAGKVPRNLEAGECVADRLVFCQETDTVQAAIEKLHEACLPSMPVVNEKFEVVGTVSIGDLIEHNVISESEVYNWAKGIFAASQIGNAAEAVS